MTIKLTELKEKEAQEECLVYRIQMQFLERTSAGMDGRDATIAKAENVEE